MSSSDALFPQPIDLAFDPSYDPSSGNVTFLSIYGATNVTFEQIQYQINVHTRQSIVYGVCIGSSFITFIVMWLVSNRRKTPVFILNQISLILVIIHSSLYFKYLFAYPSSITYYLSGFPQQFTSYDSHISAAADMFKFLLSTVIECSLVFQVKVMFAGDNFKRIGNTLLLLSIGIGLTTSAMFLTAASMMIKELYTGVVTKGNKFYNIANILFASSINFMTFILVVKLVMAIRSRRFLGLKQFDSFHILLIMSCNSLVVPSILTILAYALHSGTDVLVALSTLLVVLSLPLSSIWATSANTASTTKSISSNFNPAPSGFYPTGNQSYLSQSLKSSPTSQNFHSKLTSHFYNKKSATHESDSSYEYSSEKSAADQSHTSDIIDQNMDNFQKRTRYDIPKTQSSGTESNKENNMDDGNILNIEQTITNNSYRLYTPNTEDDMEARKFWIDDQVVDRVEND